MMQPTPGAPAADSSAHDLRTEAEARVMICPVLTPREPGASPVHCAGSRCMAWRPLRVAGDEWRGYCGLVGTPVGLQVQAQQQIIHDAARMAGMIRPDS